MSIISKLVIEDPSEWCKHINRVQQVLNAYLRSTNIMSFEFSTKMHDKTDLGLKNLIEKEFQK